MIALPDLSRRVAAVMGRAVILALSLDEKYEFVNRVSAAGVFENLSKADQALIEKAEKGTS